MKIKYFLPMLAVLVLLGQGCLPQSRSSDEPETSTASERLSDDAMESADVMDDEAMEGDAMDGAAMEEDAPASTPPAPTSEYRGWFFDVRYPDDFAASPTGPSSEYNGQMVVQTDAAQFESPDGSVSFYVYSPLWSGEPDYLRVASNETLTDERTTTADGGETITKWVTVRANDGSYYRSYVSIREQVGTGSDLHHVFGIKYADQAAYDRYRDEYIRFKSSLRQYAD